MPELQIQSPGHTRSIWQSVILGGKPSGRCKLEHYVRFHVFLTVHHSIGKGKGKAVPLQAWSGPEGFTKLKFPDFMTTAQDDGKVVSLCPQEIHLVLIPVRG